jgi:hypothetical protein
MKKISFILYIIITSLCLFFLFVYAREKIFLTPPDEELVTSYVSSDLSDVKTIYPRKNENLFNQYLNPATSHQHSLKIKNGEEIFNVNYSIDGGGYRNSKDLHLEKRKEHLLLVGCSLVFGIGIEKKDTLSHYLSEKWPKKAVYNMGLPGSGPHDHLWLLQQFDLKKYVSQTNGSMVYIYFYGQVERATYQASYYDWAEGGRPYFVLNEKGVPEYRGPIEETTSWKIVQSQKKIGLRQTSLEAFNILSNDSAERLKLFSEIVIALKNEYLKKFPNGKFYFVTVPHTYEYTPESEAIIEYLKQRGVTVSPYEEMNISFHKELENYPNKQLNVHEKEGHPNGLANKLFANEIHNWLKTMQDR